MVRWLGAGMVPATADSMTIWYRAGLGTRWENLGARQDKLDRDKGPLRRCEEGGRGVGESEPEAGVAGLISSLRIGSLRCT